jgi:F0F1-type ATP synthase assembly protein I
MSLRFEPWRLLALLPQLGLTMGISVVGLISLGFWLDRKIDSGSVFTIAGAILGMLAGLAASFKLVKSFLSDEKTEKRNNH